jgi:hypothetical protein
VTFDLVRLRFRFRALEPKYFPPGKAGNVLRGAFGTMLLESADQPEFIRIFAPRSPGGPSGLADSPRPFVFRAAALDGQTCAPGDEFQFHAHLFDRSPALRRHFCSAFARLRWAALLSVDEEEVSLDLSPPTEPARRVRVRFVTPTELKAARPRAGAEFPVLFARLRDRVSTLRALYGPGPLDIDFRAMGERAALVRLARCELHAARVERRSSRTGQTHPIGGFTGEVEYEGNLGEFLPYLRAGQWTGVGRQTPWGKGEICFQVCS